MALFFCSISQEILVCLPALGVSRGHSYIRKILIIWHEQQKHHVFPEGTFTPTLTLKWKKFSVLKLQVTSVQDNNSGKQSLSSRGKIFQKAWFIGKENDLIKKYIYLPFIHLAFSQFYKAAKADYQNFLLIVLQRVPSMHLLSVDPPIQNQT